MRIVPHLMGSIGQEHIQPEVQPLPCDGVVSRIHAFTSLFVILFSRIYMFLPSPPLLISDFVIPVARGG